MGILDFIGLGKPETAIAKKRDRALKKLTNMYYQSSDRLASADAAWQLAADGDDASIVVLLQRFEHLCPNGTNDQDEKRYVHDRLVALGSRAAPVIKDYVRKTQAVVWWPLQVLSELMDETEWLEFVAELLEAADNDYWRYPEKKLNLVQIAAEHEHERLGAALEKFVEDHLESIRFAAVDAYAKHNYPQAAALLAPRLLGAEESIRVRTRIAEAFAERKWTLGDAGANAARQMPPGFTVNAAGLVARR